MTAEIPEFRQIYSDLESLDEIIPFLKEHESKHGDDVSYTCHLYKIYTMFVERGKHTM